MIHRIVFEWRENELWYDNHLHIVFPSQYIYEGWSSSHHLMNKVLLNDNKNHGSIPYFQNIIIFWVFSQSCPVLICPSVCVCLYISRSSWAVLQFNLVPQSHPGSTLHPCDRLSQWPLHSTVGQEKAVHTGPVCGRAAGSGTVFKWVINRWVKRS